jgi:hypothetical protein
MKDASVAKLGTAAMAPTRQPSANLHVVGFKAMNVAPGFGMVELDTTEQGTGPVSLVKAPRATATVSYTTAKAGAAELLTTCRWV